ncbi:MAG: ChaN family lipoprotein [bacterium]|nr:ChaN family lipoprotein [bacterium]
MKIKKGTKKSHPRQDLLKIEKKIFRQNQDTIRDATNVKDKNFKTYYRHYKRAVKKYTKSVKVAEVEKAIQSSRIVIVGDYHTLDQSQRSFVRILRSYMRNCDRDIVVALETIQAKHQRHLEAFMDESIDENMFIKKIGFRKHWFFDLWHSYTIIFDFFRYHKIPLFGIDMSGSDKHFLRDRDNFMADKILALAKKYPDKKIFVLVGDLHLAPEHLPKEIEKRAKKEKLKLPIVTLFQNSPEIYWKLSEADLVDHTLIVKTGPKAFCRMHTPPIIVQQSYINWLYHEEGNFDWIDAKSSFLNIVERIVAILDVKLPNDYEQIEVYTCGDLGFMELSSFKKKFSKKDLQFIRTQLLHSQSYFMPEARLVYVANVSIHHAAEEASHYLKHLLTGDEKPRSHKDAFYTMVLHEAIGFFGSKLINSRRKCARLGDFQSEIKYLVNANLCIFKHVEYETAQLFIKHSRLIKKGELFHTNLVSNFSSTLFLMLTHAIGYDLGDHLYYAFMEGSVTKKKLQNLYTNLWAEEGEPQEFYLELVKSLKGVKRAGNV